MDSSSSNNNGAVSVKIPLGFRFSPKDSELVHHYLMRKIHNQPLPTNDVIKEVNLYDYEDPYALTASHEFIFGDNEWYFFTRVAKKHKHGTRKLSRTTGQGFWKASGGEVSITYQGRRIGTKVNLVFNYAKPKAMKTNWLMQEFRVGERDDKRGYDEDEWVLCKVYNHNKDALQITTPQVRAISCNVMNSEGVTRAIGEVQQTESRETNNNVLNGIQYSSDFASTSGSYHHLQGTSSDAIFQEQLNNIMLEPFRGEPLLPSTTTEINNDDWMVYDDMFDIDALDQPIGEVQQIESTETNNIVLNGIQYSTDNNVASTIGSYHIQCSSSDAIFQEQLISNMLEPFQGEPLLHSTTTENNNSMVYDDMFDIDALDPPIVWEVEDFLV